jgi:glutathione S-transferase
MVFYASSFEPAVVDRALKREPGPPSMVGYGDFDTTLATVVAQVEKGPWFLGERFTAADVLWGNALSWTIGFKIVPEHPVLVAYVERFNARPIVARLRAEDVEAAARQEAARLARGA